MDKKKMYIKKTVIWAAILILFLFATNPALIPFVPASFKSRVGDVWASLFGDVDDIARLFTFNWAAIFKLTAMILLLVILTNIGRWIISLLHPKTGRGKSIVTLISSILDYLAGIVGIIWGLSIVGVNVSTIFAGVGILALVISFGAESLIADVITGIFLVFDNQFNVGDIIELDGFRGTVMQIGIRTTYLKDAGGNVKIVNNSDIRNVLNRSAASSIAYCDISIAYSESIEEAETALLRLLPGIKEKYPDVFLQTPEYVGVQSLGSSAVDLRVVAEVREEDVYLAPRLLRRELKIGFDEAGIEIPFQQVVIHNARE